MIKKVFYNLILLYFLCKFFQDNKYFVYEIIILWYFYIDIDYLYYLFKKGILSILNIYIYIYIYIYNYIS